MQRSICHLSSRFFVGVVLCTTACASIDPASEPDSVATTADALASGTVSAGLGVVDIEVLDGVKCTGFLLNSFMIMTAAHCVYSGVPEGTHSFKIRSTSNGRNWSCISGPTRSGKCSGWSTASYAAWNTRPPEDPDPASDYAIIYRPEGFSDGHSVGIAPDQSWVADSFEVWGRSGDVMRHAVGFVDQVVFRVFKAAYFSSTAVTCRGDSGGPAFAFNPTSQTYAKYASGLAVMIQPPSGFAGDCAKDGDLMVYNHFGKYTIDAINWVATDRLGLNVCPYCMCTDLGPVFPGAGLDGDYVCNAF
jgi:V8-like Glu-specific endopeptidase